MPVAVNHPAIPNEATPTPAHSPEDSYIANAYNAMDMTMDNMMRFFKAWTFQMSKANERRHGGYQTARVYDIQADHPPRHK